MKAPEFWKQRGLLAWMLWPLSGIWSGVTRLRLAMNTPFRASVPVICCGNVVAGGSGKTPLCAMLAEYFASRKPAVLSRGYGANIDGVVKVDATAHRATDCGDEPLMLARKGLTVYVSADRVASAKQAIADGAGLLIMDDGMQNPALHQDITLLCMNGTDGFGNGMVIPAGPCREAPARALARADAVVVNGETPHHFDVPVFQVNNRCDFSGLDRNQSYVAFAGIAYPQRFFDSLRDAGFSLAATQAFGDHQSLHAQDMDSLKALAKQHDATLITTEKDAARLGDAFEVAAIAMHTHSTPETALEQWLEARL